MGIVISFNQNNIKQMKKILNLSTLTLLFFAAIFMTSCEEEPGGGTGGGTGGGGTNEENPTISISSSTDLTVAPGEIFTIDFSAAKGDEALKAITIYADGVKVSADRITVNGTPAASNAILITGDDKEGLSWSATIAAHTEASTTVQYEIEIQDDADLVTSAFVSVTTAATPPTLTGSEPFTIEGLEQGSKNGFKLSATPGDGKLISIEVLEDGVRIEDVTRIEWDGATMMSATNPFTLDTPEQDGFEDVRLFIVLPQMEGTYVYTMIITDEFGLTDEVAYTVTTAPAGTAVDVRTDVLLNQAGPSGTGGLDLDEGLSTGSGSDLAELVDNGIDTDQPDDKNWIQNISTANGATMKYVVAGAEGITENFTFADVAFKEEIADLYNNNTGGIINETNSTAIIAVGDNFVVTKDGKFWLLTVTEVGVTPDNNDDFYRFDVKF